VRPARPHSRWLAGAALAAASAAAAAQTAATIELAPSDGVECLTTTTGKPEAPVYPAEELKAGRGAVFRAAFTFTSPTRAPRVEFPDQRSEQAFSESVSRYAALLRMPCLTASAPPVTLTREFIFQIDDDRVVMTPPRDVADAERRRLTDCIRHTSGERMPPYPEKALREGRHARVFAAMRFVDAQSPPSMTILARRSAEAFKAELEAWSRDLRMPCHSGEPVNTFVTFSWAIEGNTRPGFREMDLRAWVGITRHIRQRGFKMDLTAMGCPFAVSITYLRPERANWVRQIGTPDPRREPFIAWLRESELDLGPSVLDAVFADNVRIDVPCLRFNVPPEEKPR
jgi:hypothetical protein